MSSFIRQPLLKPEVEEQLKCELSDLWGAGFNGAYIVDKLGFGVPGSKYEKLRPCYLYFYRAKFGLPKRREGACRKGESRYKVSPKELKMLSFSEFEDKLNERAPANTFHNRRKRTYLILHFWTPLRKSEIYDRVIGDFEVHPEYLIIHLLRKKKKHKRTVRDEPIKIPRAFPLMDEVVSYLQHDSWGGSHNRAGRPWRISHTTAWNYVNSVFENYYSHFFRFEYITKGLEDPATSVAELVSKTGLHFVTINKYIADSIRHQDTFDKRLLERVRAERGV